MSQKQIAYISSKDYLDLCDKHPKVKIRASLVHSLIEAYDLQAKLNTVEPEPASREDLLLFHSVDYVKCMEKIQEITSLSDGAHEKVSDESFCYDEIEDLNSTLDGHGLGYDCAVFKEMYDYVKLVTGATIKAAEMLLTNQADISINFHGGWHHAHVDEAAGFCYVNDIVIGILKLLTKYKRILYIDLDVHHGDGVEEAFQYSKSVITWSLHKLAEGYFPGTGNKNNVGCGAGKYHTINVPLKDGINDEMYCNLFVNVFSEITNIFDPEVIVCQCGADALSGDPMGDFNLTSKAYIDCVRYVCQNNVPVMILGGGGYNMPNTARCWTAIIASLVGVKLDDDIPDHEFLEHYGPDYTIQISASNRKNENSKEYIENLETCVIANINQIETRNKVAKVSNGAEKENKENLKSSETTTIASVSSIGKEVIYMNQGIISKETSVKGSNFERPLQELASGKECDCLSSTHCSDGIIKRKHSSGELVLNKYPKKSPERDN